LALRGVITLKGASVISGFQWGQWFGGCAEIDAMVRELLDAEGQEPRVAEWERELNALVYELYGLTGEEIGIVEGR
jgi:hypothetical protein